MKVSIFADEISRDPERSTELALEWGITHVEVRSLPSGRFPAVEDEELETYVAMLKTAGLKVSGVSPGFFKCPVDDPQVDVGIREGLPRSCEWAQRMGTTSVSSFAFRKGPEDSGDPPQAVIDRMGEMADATARQGCRLTLENEAVCWGATGREAAAIVRAVGTDRLELLWDPGNSARAGSTDAYPEEYDSFADIAAHIHAKNFDPEAGAWSLIEKGAIDWPGQLKALKENAFDGYLVIETHLAIHPDEFEVKDPSPKGLEENSRRNLDWVRKQLT